MKGAPYAAVLNYLLPPSLAVNSTSPEVLSMSKRDFIPSGEAEFDEFADKFVDKAVADPAAVGLTPAQVTALQGKRTTWKQQRARRATAELEIDASFASKKSARSAYEGALRQTARQINADPKTTNATRASLGLPPHQEVRSPVPAPKTRPAGRVVSNEGLQQTVLWSDKGNQDTRRKPDGVHGCEVWLKIDGTPPTTVKECEMVGHPSSGPVTYEFTAADAGKTAHWLFRWVNAKGDTGPLSEVMSVPINR